MANFENDGIYIKSYIREINDNGIGPLELKYTKINTQVPNSPLKNAKFVTNSLDVNNDTRYLIPELSCDINTSPFCLTIDNIVKEIEQDLRKKIVFYNPVKFKVNFSPLDSTFESETHLGITEISAYHYLSAEDSPIKYNYPQSLVRQFITNDKIPYTDCDFVVTLSEDESSYIVNAGELANKSDGYDLKLVLYHEILHGLGIKSEATGYPNYLLSYNNVQPSDYTSFVDDRSYLIIFIEPTIYDSFIYNDNFINRSLGEELQPMAERLPIIRDKLGSIKNELYALTNVINEVIERNFTVLTGAMYGYQMVTHEGLYFKGQSHRIPLHVIENKFEPGVSISHTKHYDNEVEGDKILLDWKIPSGKILADSNMVDKKQPSGIMGPEITDMLHSLGWPTIDDMQQKKFKVEESVEIFSLLNDRDRKSVV